MDAGVSLYHQQAAVEPGMGVHHQSIRRLCIKPTSKSSPWSVADQLTVVSRQRWRRIWPCLSRSEEIWLLSFRPIYSNIQTRREVGPCPFAKYLVLQVIFALTGVGWLRAVEHSTGSFIQVVLV
jgi:hypothetical protein